MPNVPFASCRPVAVEHAVAAWHSCGEKSRRKNSRKSVEKKNIVSKYPGTQSESFTQCAPAYITANSTKQYGAHT